VDDLAKTYLAKYANVMKKSWEEDERILEADMLPGIVERGSPIAANRTWAVVRKMLNCAYRRI